MAKDTRAVLDSVASKKVQQLLIALLFISMGIIGFSSGRGTGSEISRELSNMFGGDSELLLYLVSTLELVAGIFLAAHVFMKSIPDKFVKLSMTVIMFFWLALIIILDVLTIDFGRFDGSEWITWIEQTVLHLIVLSSIMQIQK